MGWNVLHVKPRREKKVAEHCEHLNIEYYLPLRQETKVYQRRKVTVSKPVFPGYVFAAFGDEGRLSLLKTNSLVRVLQPTDESGLVHELAQVRAALAVDPTLGATAALKKGRIVRILGGPFRGIEGRIEMLKGQAMVCLNVDMIGQAIRVEVDRSLVELAD